MNRVERSFAHLFKLFVVLAFVWGLGNPIARGQISVQDVEGTNEANAGVPQLEMTRLGRGVHDHGSVSAGDRLYVIGGVRGGEKDSEPSVEVDSFPMVSTGGVGPLRAEAPLTRPLAGLGSACAVWEDQVIYVAGGSDSADGNSPVSNRVEIGSLGKGGIVSSWQESSPWPGPPLTRVAVTVWRGEFFVVGGLDSSGKASSQVYRAPILKDGTLGNWSVDEPLPEGRLGHGICTSGGRMLVIGGRSGLGKPPSWEVLSADLGTSGSISAWQREPVSLPYALAGGVGCLSGDRYVWLGGAKDNEQPFRDLIFTFLVRGHPRPWVTLKLGLSAPYGLAAASDEDGRLIYASGGRESDKTGPGTPGIIALAMGPESVSKGNTSSSDQTGSAIQSNPLEINKVRLPGGNQTAEPSPHFESEQDAFQEARKRHRPMLLLVYSSHDKETMQLRENLLSSGRFLQLMEGVVLGEVDVVKDPSAGERYDTKKLPLFLVYNADGALKRQNTTARTLKDFAKITLDVQ